MHASILPKYRGAAPIQWSLMNGDSTTGVSVFQIEKKVDAGKIIIQENLNIDKNDNYEIISNKLSNIGAMALIKSLDLLEKGDVSFIQQNNSVFTNWGSGNVDNIPIVSETSDNLNSAVSTLSVVDP